MSETTICADSHVTFHYLLTDGAGTEIDNSTGKQPMQYIHGHRAIFPAVEEALTGLKAGEVISITLSPEEAWGAHDPDYVIEVPRDRFDFELEVGGVVQGQSQEQGLSQPLLITGLGKDTVTLDGNHPMAGKTICFTIKIETVRAATAQELAALDRGPAAPPTTQ